MSDWNSLSGRCPNCFCTPHDPDCAIGKMEGRIEELERVRHILKSNATRWKKLARTYKRKIEELEECES